jgi:hypothetical protein
MAYGSPSKSASTQKTTPSTSPSSKVLPRPTKTNNSEPLRQPIRKRPYQPRSRLSPLRTQNVIILGGGMTVHNLRASMPLLGSDRRNHVYPTRLQRSLCARGDRTRRRCEGTIWTGRFTAWASDFGAFNAVGCLLWRGGGGCRGMSV